MAPFSFSLWWSLFFVIGLRYCLKGKDCKRNTISLVKSLARFVPSISSSNPKILALELANLCLVTYGQLKVIPGIVYMNYVPGHNELDIFCKTDCNLLL